MRNNALWELAGEHPIERHTKRRKWKWVGHTLRKKGDANERQALEWKG
jgi:hypothetical protein